MGDDPKDSRFGYLVLVRSLTRRVSPQWWRELYFGERGDRRASVVAFLPLAADDAGLPLDELARRYPLASQASGGRV